MEILISMAPVLAIALISNILRLGIASSIIVSTIRTFVQLSILGSILDPIFILGEDLWWLVLGYCFLMILLASYEGSTRSKYYIYCQFWMVLFPMFINVVAIALFAFCVVIKPEPRWDPQYVIPIVGMLLGNCINGVSLALNSLFTSLVECSREVELLLSFGADEYESTSRLVREAVKNGAIPQLNSMAIIGLISIPGMMTGQILGGTSVMQAARYQILIMYFTAMCSFGTILMELNLALRFCFDSRSMLRIDLLQKRGKKPNFLAVIASSVRVLFQNLVRMRGTSHRRSSSSTGCAGELTYFAPGGDLDVSIISHEAKTNKEQEEAVISVENLSYGFKTRDDEKGSEFKNDNNIRILFENLSFKMYPGDTALITGPSGVGKSTLLRIIAGLTDGDTDAEKIKLYRNTQEDFTSMPLWRKIVRYVPQTKVDIPGTPNDFITKITSFSTWKRENINGDMLSYSYVKSTTQELIRNWGMNINLLNSEWKILSGGESQRMLVAISLASLCKGGVILLDEATSALDLDTKIKVEKSVEEYCTKLCAVAMW
eukprot:CAMPEP_0201130610 /NCGR_PEP_ID=MMETSP0850-20130426/40334_1 /ASSEMBLY_ACC=CAM_ASM_000622 /TAXON_ID=183588 /ORGANISM="Pseudo-nitzschia fraudulenta, Strain WWA7" /LENGTH=545 /DNA_ID=CAMNT_0047400409 /DNA_START=19 /DNA_END=1653 /DNA_ORIENTATION=+